MTRRALDLVVSFAVLVVTSPLLVVLVLAAGVHTSERVGRGGTTFRLHKVRTMRTGVAGPAVTRTGDPRVTRLGALLRATKLDELPQLWDVLRGDMSLVGPRPEDPRYVAGYTAEQRRVLDVRPGITSPATLLLRDEERVLQALGGDLDDTYRTLVLPAKLAIDAEYLARATVRSDVGVLLRTVVAIVRRPPVDEQVATVRRLAVAPPGSGY